MGFEISLRDNEWPCEASGSHFDFMGGRLTIQVEIESVCDEYSDNSLIVKLRKKHKRKKMKTIFSGPIIIWRKKKGIKLTDIPRW